MGWREGGRKGGTKRRGLSLGPPALICLNPQVAAGELCEELSAGASALRMAMAMRDCPRRVSRMLAREQREHHVCV